LEQLAGKIMNSGDAEEAVALPVFSPGGEHLGETPARREVFAAKVNPHLLHAAVVAHLAGQRQGTASTKTRGKVAGSTRKLFRQKGTGRARMGSRRSPIRVGGGTIFGPLPREYHQRLPRKVRRQALCGALSSRAAAGEIGVLDSLALEKISTKTVAHLLKALGREDGVLLITDEPDEALCKSARNLPMVKLARATDLNVYEVLRHRYLLFTREGLSRLQEALLAEPAQGRVAAAPSRRGLAT